MKKKSYRTEILLGTILLLLFAFSFFNYLSMKNKENEYQEWKQAKEKEGNETEEIDNHEMKINENTKIFLMNLDDQTGKQKINIPKNSICLEMGFTEFRQCLEDNPKKVLTDTVYQLKKDYNPASDHITILSFSDREIILGISCGQREETEVNSRFKYLAIVDDSVFTVYHIDSFNDYTTVFLICKEEDLDLPDDIREKLNFGVYFEDDMQLYNFLESYSS